MSKTVEWSLDSETFQRALEAMMKELVRSGILPRSAPADVYLTHWNAGAKALRAALGAAGIPVTE